MVDSQDHIASQSSRRKFLHGVGATGIVGGLAGCMGGDDDSDGTDGPTNGDGEPKRDTLRRLATTPPGEVRWTPVGDIQAYAYNMAYGMGAGIPPYWDGTLDDPYNVFHGTYVESSKLLDDRRTWEITFKEDPQFKWENGEDVLIDDRVLREKYQLKYEKLTSDSPPDFTEIRKVDDYTMQQVYREEIHPGNFFVGRHPEIRRPRWMVEEWWERMDDATTAEEAEEIHTEATSDENGIGLGDLPSMGIWKLEEIRDVEVLYTLNEEHPYSDEQNVENFLVTFKGNESAQRLAWQNEEVDMGATPPENTNLSEGWETRSRRTPRSAGFWFNWANNPHFSRRGVRRAIAYALDPTAICKNVNNDDFAPVKGQFGMPDTVAQTWLPDYEGLTSQLIDYGAEAQPDKAAEAMESEGYTQEGGTWVDPDGNALEIKYIDNEWWPLFAQTMESNLQRAGFSIEVQQLPDSHYQVREYDDRDWNMTMASHGPRYNSYPGGCFTNRSYGPLGGLPIEDFQEEKETQFGVPHEVTIPSEPGATEISGSGETINLVEERKIFDDPNADNEEIQETIDRFARWFNFDMPKPLMGDALAITTRNYRDFNWVDVNGDGSLLSHGEGGVGWHLAEHTSKVE